jgi:hypothetical protein
MEELPNETERDFIEEKQLPSTSPRGSDPIELTISNSNPARTSILETIAESGPVMIVMSLLTIWALFSDDIRLSVAKKDADFVWAVVISIAFFLFLAELLASCTYKKGYLGLPNFRPVPGEFFRHKFHRLLNFGSFYFWLDLIATVSLIFEVLDTLSIFALIFPFASFLKLDPMDHWR